MSAMVVYDFRGYFSIRNLETLMVCSTVHEGVSIRGAGGSFVKVGNYCRVYRTGSAVAVKLFPIVIKNWREQSPSVFLRLLWLHMLRVC